MPFASQYLIQYLQYLITVPARLSQYLTPPNFFPFVLRRARLDADGRCRTREKLLGFSFSPRMGLDGISYFFQLWIFQRSPTASGIPIPKIRKYETESKAGTSARPKPRRHIQNSSQSKIGFLRRTVSPAFSQSLCAEPKPTQTQKEAGAPHFGSARFVSAIAAYFLLPFFFL